MVFPVVGGDGKPTGYDIDNSLRFNDGDSPYLNRTFATPTNRKKFTFSAWYKRSTLSTTQYIISYDSGGLSMGIIGFSSTDKFIIYDRDSSSGSADIDYNTTQLFRDVSAWYHIVVSIDTADGTSGDRVKIYVNGTRITSFDTSTAPAQNYDTIMNSAVSHDIGRWQAGSSYYDGYMSEINYVDGQALDSSYFGETDDNGVWIPKVYDGTYGNSGFFLEFKQTGTSANSSGMGADTSGNDNHFAVTNLAAVDVTTDTPTNNFCTGNPIAKYINDTNVTFSEGNVKGVAGAVATSYNFLGTFGSANMNFYFEAKATDVNQNNDTRIGVVPVDSTAGIAINGEHNQVVYRGDGSVVSTGETALTSQGNITDGMIVGVAVDPDNNVKWYLNGTLTSTQSINSTYRGPVYMPYFRHINSGTVEFNFGNPSFSISSGNSDANGYGNFEYAVPSGYYALCTKNLAEFG
jgi:hypothetical protein